MSTINHYILLTYCRLCWYLPSWAFRLVEVWLGAGHHGHGNHPFHWLF